MIWRSIRLDQTGVSKSIHLSLLYSPKKNLKKYGILQRKINGALLSIPILLMDGLETLLRRGGVVQRKRAHMTIKKRTRESLTAWLITCCHFKTHFSNPPASHLPCFHAELDVTSPSDSAKKPVPNPFWKSEVIASRPH